MPLAVVDEDGGQPDLLLLGAKGVQVVAESKLAVLNLFKSRND